MENNFYIPLTNRALLAISGDDAHIFLQGLITNDIHKLSPSQAVYALMLTPQGKFLYDFFIYDFAGKIFLDCNALKIEEIKKKLAVYKLRSKIVIEDLSSEYQVVALSSTNQVEGMVYSDPRSAALPLRAIINKQQSYQDSEKSGLSLGRIADYEKIRILLCIPSDLELEDSFPLEYEMDKHNAINYEKGCYVGQEVTARTHYRGTIRKKPYLVKAAEDVDLSGYIGQEITYGDIKAGILRSAIGNKGIALLRTDDLEKSSEELKIDSVALFKISNN